MATTSLNVTVDWNAVEGQTKDEHFGINVYRAVADAGNSKYRSNMSHMSPGIIRFHNMDYIKDSSKDHGLIDTENKTWDVQKVVNTIQASIDMFGADQPQRMFNIPSWPSWMDANKDGYLDSDRFDEYANLCADLVKIVNKDNNLGVQYWEITNEKDIEYFSIFHTKSGWGKLIDPNQPDRLDELITIYNKVAEAMKAVDPSIKVGGPSIARPDLTPFYEPFIKGTADNLDFFTYHYYPTGSAATPDDQVFNAANSIGKYTKTIVDTLKKISPNRDIPAMLGEYNISWTWETHDPRMTNNKGAVFDALSMIEAIENGAAASLSWNEKDGSYGKTSYNDTLRPGGELLHLFNEYLVGNRISTTSDNSSITTFAVDRPGSHKAYVLINSSNSPQEVAVTFNNWNLTTSHVSKHIISDSGYSQELTAWDTVNNSTIVLPANSVLLFEDDSPEVSVPPTSEPNPTPPSDPPANTDTPDVSLPTTSEPNPTPPSDPPANTDTPDVSLPTTSEPNPTPPSDPPANTDTPDVSLPTTSEPNPTPPSDTPANTDTPDVGLPTTSEPNPTPPSDTPANTDTPEVSLPPTGEPNPTPPSDTPANTDTPDVGLPTTSEPNPTPPSDTPANTDTPVVNLPTTSEPNPTPPSDTPANTDTPDVDLPITSEPNPTPPSDTPANTDSPEVSLPPTGEPNPTPPSDTPANTDTPDVDLPITSEPNPTIPSDTQGNTDSPDVGLPTTSEPNPTPPSDTPANTDNPDVDLPTTSEPNPTIPSDTQGNTDSPDVGLPPTGEPNPTIPSDIQENAHNLSNLSPDISPTINSGNPISSPENISAIGTPYTQTSTTLQSSTPTNLSYDNQPARFDNVEFSSKVKDSSTNIASLLLSSGKSVSQSLKSAIDTPRNISGSQVTDKTTIGEPEIAAVLNTSNDSQAPLLDLRKTDLNKDGQIDNKVFVNFYDVTSHAVYNNTVGFYKIANVDGAVFDSLTGKLIPPGEKGYVQIALEQRVLEVELNRNTGKLMTQLEGGALYAPYLIASGTAQEYLSNISGNPTSNQTPQAFFSYGVGNPDNINHVKLLGKNQLGFEDTIGGGDKDYNDLMFKVKVQSN
ncbi:hypothetical protein WA1_21130 [Scytonema hofmannii PCC 7110]|uniref:Uncharacterized protein n=1 Tax=Scytonema hofmannii PCC 7110 TaxID=128403 RepID=A0A139XCP9_9CYAN|nr:DUF4114 domain-containing protein [Scytonema hofmannii]KYC42470.1 hypothetical protein WA1_21130 [Scytonema hofmannii PCC 7110]